ncbi:MAG TPA: glycosyl hydrolase [Tepidisphaeraceae bacterium]|nr:glycosyl hydrolase [Tepidisphaeraceae bacterium]
MNHPSKALMASAAAVFCFLNLNISANAQQPTDSLTREFVNPPDSARPRVWWHWTGGNVTLEGITKDLEWMKRVGIGGAQAADIGQGGGQVIDNPITFFSPAWFEAIKHAASESDRLGLEMTIFSSSGWSLTGGPWVKPEQAMKKLVWSQTDVQGPMKFSGKLPQPPSNNGNFGGLRGLNSRGGAVSPAPALGARGEAAPSTQPDGAGRRGRGAGPGRGGAAPARSYYGDSAVVAFRTPSDETLMEDLRPTASSSSDAVVDPAPMMDDNLATSVVVPAGQDGTAWLQYQFAQPVNVRAVTLIAASGGASRGIPYGQIQVSDDGQNFRTIVELPGAIQYRSGSLKTYAFPETTAKFVRVRMTGGGPGPDPVIYQTAPQPANSYGFSEFIVHTGARVDRWEEKAGFNFFYQYEVAPTPAVPNSSLIQPAEVVDLTSKMDRDGNLNWDVPQGKWTILRMGYSLVGSMVRAGTAGGAGLEVDKLNAKHVTDYFHGYMDPIKADVGDLMGKSLKYMVMDSWEAGMQNWTDDMIQQFKTRRGYDPTPYLPVLSGRVVGSADLSDRFLWDFRRTIADLIADAHYGTMADELHKYGMGLYSEAPGVSMEIIEDTLLTKSKVDIPMGEFWLGRMHPPPEYYVDVRMAAASAHVYGKKIVATESFTGGGYDSPATYKNLADYWYAQGVNRIIFHSSAQQPLDTKPGNTMVGTHFNRNITWAEQAKPLLDYMSRTQYMLQQGLFVADFSYLLNESPPSSQPFWGAGIQPTPLEGYDYDTLNADALLNRVKVSDDGRMVLPDGMSYRILVLPQIDRMRPELLAKIRELVMGGVTLVGPKPTLSPSLQGGFPAADLAVQKLANEIWGDLDGIQRNKHFLGKGLVTWGLPLDQVVSLVNLPKDAEFAGPLDANVVWIHRRTPEADLYFVANRRDKTQDIQARFRVDGKEAEIFHPDTGIIEPAGYSIENGRTTVPLHLDERESVFVVFRHPTTTLVRNLPIPAENTVATLVGPWAVTFPPNWGAPPSVQLDKLASWNSNSDEGVKYFSGTATYTQHLPSQPNWFGQGNKLWLDLGKVGDIAEVSINGKMVGTLWKPPYRIDVTDSLKPGDNQLQIKITNEWSNRIAGDRGAPPEKRILAQARGRAGGGGGFGRGFGATPPESGLIGPVTLVSVGSK